METNTTTTTTFTSFPGGFTWEDARSGRWNVCTDNGLDWVATFGSAEEAAEAMAAWRADRG